MISRRIALAALLVVAPAHAQESVRKGDSICADVPGWSGQLCIKDGWRPIDTAPKDGRRIWVFGRDSDGRSWQGVIGWMDWPKFAPAAWYGLPCSPGLLTTPPSPQVCIQPTHWRDLPEDPR